MKNHESFLQHLLVICYFQDQVVVLANVGHITCYWTVIILLECETQFLCPLQRQYSVILLQI